MEAIKWICSILAAVLLVAMVVGGVLGLAAVAAIGGAVVCLMGLVLTVANSIKQTFLPRKFKR